MAKLFLYDREMSLEEYIVAEICANHGSHTRVQAEEIKYILDKCNISYQKKSTKKEMIYQLYEYYKDWRIVAEELGVGVKVTQYIKAFPFITNADIKRLEKFGVLKIVGYQSFRAYGKQLYSPLYDLKQFQDMSEMDMRKFIEAYPKGKRKSNQEDIKCPGCGSDVIKYENGVGVYCMNCGYDF